MCLVQVMLLEKFVVDPRHVEVQVGHLTTSSIVPPDTT